MNKEYFDFISNTHTLFSHEAQLNVTGQQNNKFKQRSSCLNSREANFFNLFGF